MRIVTIGVVLAATLLAIPVAAMGQVTGQDRQNAARECRLERGSTVATRMAFKARYGTNANQRNAFGKCVSRRARQEAAERREARQSAESQCRAELQSLGRSAFEQKYRTNHNTRNAFGKCVSQKARAAKARLDRRDRQRIEARKNAAKACAAERADIGRAAFAMKYGTNHNRRNAFGKCVSQKARAQH
jgi:hypothetical protein